MPVDEGNIGERCVLLYLSLANIDILSARKEDGGVHGTCRSSMYTNTSDSTGDETQVYLCPS